MIIIKYEAIYKFEEEIFITKLKCITGVSADRNQVKVRVQKLPDRPGIAGELFTRFAKNKINVDLIVQNFKYNDTYNDLTFTIDKNDLLENNRILSDLTAKLGAQNAEVDTTVAKITVYGKEMITTPNVAASVFKVLGDANINIQIITTSNDQICCIIDERDSDEAVRTIEKEFKTN